MPTKFPAFLSFWRMKLSVSTYVAECTILWSKFNRSFNISLPWTVLRSNKSYLGQASQALNGFIHRGTLVPAVLCTPLTIRSICAQYIKYSDTNYLDDSLVRSIVVSHWIMCLTRQDHLTFPLEISKLGVSSLFIN